VYLTDLADVLRSAGLKVVEIPGWKTRGRPGTFDPKGVLCHHTGGKPDGLSYATWMAITGRTDLAAPLAQLGLDREGTFYVQAAGRANHAGRCKAIAGLKAYPGRDYGDGNAQMIGIEAMNTGSEGWSDTQYGAYVRGVAALCTHYGWSIVLGHRETSLSGKPDPGLIDLDKFRRDVRATNPATQEDDMPTMDEMRAVFLTKADGQTLRNDIGHARDQMLAAANPAKLAAAVAAALPAGAVSDDQLEAALRKVLGSVDGASA